MMEEKQERYKCLAIPIKLYAKIERAARRKRIATGNNISWSGEAKDVLETKYK